MFKVSSGVLPGEARYVVLAVRGIHVFITRDIHASSQELVERLQQCEWMLAEWDTLSAEAQDAACAEWDASSR